MPAKNATRAGGLLIAAEGLDGSGKSAGLDSLSRWLEGKGRRVHVVPWVSSRLVARASRAPGGRQALTPRVAALLGAAEAARRFDREIREPLAKGHVVLADRYAWTAVVREVARGLEPDWVSAVYRIAPTPDLVIFHRQDPRAALARALASRPSPVGAEAVSAAYGTFLGRMVAAFDHLVADPGSGPWPVRTLVLDPRGPLDARVAAVRDAVRPMLDSPVSGGPWK